MIERTYGWVQNPSDFEKLKLVVQIFDNQSEHYLNLKNNLISKYIPLKKIKKNLQEKFDKGENKFFYKELVGSSKDINGNNTSSRKKAIADGLIQITIKPQNKNKMWTDNWTADGYLRWALSLNFIKHDRSNDLCEITDLGLKFSRSTNISEINEIMTNALLSYPPATRVLEILNTASKPVTKFYIGDKLGFKGEKGFTSYSDNEMKEWFISSTSTDEQKKIKNDIEGTSDKYARMIASWLEKIKLVSKTYPKIKTKTGLRKGFVEYKITSKGKYELKKSLGISKNKKIKKYITWEFLATNCVNKTYVKTRRAHILQILKNSSNKEISTSNLLRKLKNYNFNDDENIINNDINGLNNIGIRIEKRNNKIKLIDDLYDFSIPNLPINNKNMNNNLTIMNKKNTLMKNTNLPSKYYELIEIAYDGKRNRDFEILTIDLLKNVYGFSGKFLGGSRKPDGIIFTKDYGIIIDTKAYSNGYSKNIGQEDEMIRYIEENKKRDININPNKWWDNFPSNLPISSCYFMWISSEFKQTFDDQLNSTYTRTQTKGASLNVEQLLYGADLVKKGMINLQNIQSKINNKEIKFK